MGPGDPSFDGRTRKRKIQQKEQCYFYLRCSRAGLGLLCDVLVVAVVVVVVVIVVVVMLVNIFLTLSR